MIEFIPKQENHWEPPVLTDTMKIVHRRKHNGLESTVKDMEFVMGDFSATTVSMSCSNLYTENLTFSADKTIITDRT